jgi:hypothetical protein
MSSSNEATEPKEDSIKNDRLGGKPPLSTIFYLSFGPVMSKFQELYLD